jgi:hypothetical protein
MKRQDVVPQSKPEVWFVIAVYGIDGLKFLQPVRVLNRKSAITLKTPSLQRVAMKHFVVRIAHLCANATSLDNRQPSGLRAVGVTYFWNPIPIRVHVTQEEN